MANYIPLKAPIDFACVNSNLLSCTYDEHVFVADFAIPGDASNVLRVEFTHMHIVRILDEMPLSTEEPSPKQGLIPNHFAYVVEGALFWRSQSEAFRALWPNARHYRFVTGWTCLDVIANEAPTMVVCARAR